MSIASYGVSFNSCRIGKKGTPGNRGGRQCFEAVAHLKQIAEKRGRSLPQFALAWVLNNETITSAICGATSLKQLEENLGATEVKLSKEELAACDEVWQKLSPRPKLFYGR